MAGVSPGEGNGATMSDDDDDQADSETNLFDGSLDGTDTMGFGPLVPTESERSLMERVRQELKHELKHVGSPAYIHRITFSIQIAHCYECQPSSSFILGLQREDSGHSGRNPS